MIHDSDARRIAALCYPEPLGKGSIFIPPPTILEIGPGLGIASKFLAQKTSELILIEKDKRLAAYLELQLSLRETEESIFSFSPSNNINILNQDFLQFTFPSKKIIVVGNIPYNIASPILLKLIENKKYFFRCILMLPLEMSEKLMASSGELYGVLSLTVQLDFEIMKGFRVKASGFYPQPQVDSMVLSLSPKPDILSLQQKEAFYQIIKKAFQNRRKMLRKIFSDIREWDALGLNPKSRPQDLSLQDYIHWSKTLNHP
ncbi:MAG: ribosomal RNA small subunit methyltransferase A [Deltaproteobacteria bacterium]|nr:ribosomal RNA small subunit methyltransferase A [Deltaproteobacteria bacterium]